MPMLLITPSLLNSWAYIFKGNDGNKALADFIHYLKREPSEPNVHMQRGIDFEKLCVDGKEPTISPIIEGGAFQLSASKVVEVDGIMFLIYGRLDVLKAGKGYDIKSVVKYETQKYFDSYQHHCYFEIVPEMTDFTYLISNGRDVYFEEYSRDEMIDLKKVISQFIQYLKTMNLFEIYVEKWRARQ